MNVTNLVAVSVVALVFYVGVRYCLKFLRGEISPRIATWLIFEIRVAMSMARCCGSIECPTYQRRQIGGLLCFMQCCFFPSRTNTPIFVNHESDPDAEGMLSAEESQRLELRCDSLAIKISVHIGTKRNLIQICTGMGALAFYRVMQLCRGVKDRYTSAGRTLPNALSVDANTHPTLDQRIAAIVAELLQPTAASDQGLVRGHVNGFLGMLDTMERLTLTMIDQAITMREGQAERT